MKKIVSTVVVLVMTLALCITAFAEVNTCALDSSKCVCNIAISDNSATCYSRYQSVGNDATKVVITQSLEKQGFFWTWSKVAGEWTKTSSGGSMALTNTVTGLAKGKYRVKSVFAVTDNNGNVETIPLYSSVQTVG